MTERISIKVSDSSGKKKARKKRKKKKKKPCFELRKASLSKIYLSLMGVVVVLFFFKKKKVIF